MPYVRRVEADALDQHESTAAVYRKVQLYGGDESDTFVAGDALVVTEVCGLKMGFIICFDVEFPEVARSLARADAELLVTISATCNPQETITQCSPRPEPWRTGFRTSTSIRSVR